MRGRTRTRNTPKGGATVAPPLPPAQRCAQQAQQCCAGGGAAGTPVPPARAGGGGGAGGGPPWAAEGQGDRRSGPFADAAARGVRGLDGCLAHGRPGRPPKPQDLAVPTPDARRRARAAALPLDPLAPRLLDLRAAAQYLGLGERRVRDLLAAGVLRRVPVPAPGGGTLRKVLLDRQDLDDAVATWKGALGPPVPQLDSRPRLRDRGERRRAGDVEGIPDG